MRCISLALSPLVTDRRYIRIILATFITKHSSCFLLFSLFFAVDIFNLSCDVCAVFGVSLQWSLHNVAVDLSALSETLPERSGARAVQVAFIFATTGTDGCGADYYCWEIYFYLILFHIIVLYSEQQQVQGWIPYFALHINTYLPGVHEDNIDDTLPRWRCVPLPSHSHHIVVVSCEAT